MATSLGLRKRFPNLHIFILFRYEIEDGMCNDPLRVSNASKKSETVTAYQNCEPRSEQTVDRERVGLQFPAVK
jgi:hypothetical protein